MSWRWQRGGYELFFNRDERATRRSADPPRIEVQGDVRYLAPRDAEAGGTWLAANEHGLTLGLLNGPERGAARTAPTRGGIVRGLADAPDLLRLERRLRALELGPFRPFLLLALAPSGHGLVAGWQDGALDVEHDVDRRMPLVSSAFDAEEVQRGRAALFGVMREELGADSSELHLRYHESHRPARGPRSICMHRADAQTVSFSWIRVEPGAVSFRYSAHPPCAGRPAGEGLTLERR